MLEPFDQEKYLNLESYRRNGVGVRTPIWFARNGERLYAYSWERSGKVKRIRNSPRVRIVPCSARGDPRGKWIEARAHRGTGGGEAGARPARSEVRVAEA